MSCMNLVLGIRFNVKWIRFVSLFYEAESGSRFITVFGIGIVGSERIGRGLRTI